MKEQYIKIDSEGNKFYYSDKEMTILHREDGPAIECFNGDREWHINGKRHREDGPACEWCNGNKSWWKNGKRHREDGPAIERANGPKSWYLNDKHYTEEEFNKINKNSLELTLDEIADKFGVSVENLRIKK